MTGAGVRSAQAQSDPLGQTLVAFTLQPEEADLFADFTREHQGQFLTIVLDKQVISSPQIQSEIDGGQGTITGQFTVEGRAAVSAAATIRQPAYSPPGRQHSSGWGHPGRAID